MPTRNKRNSEFKSKFPARFDSCPGFDVFQNIMFATLRQTLQDVTSSGSRRIQQDALVWLNSQDCYDLLCELALEDVIRDFLQERGLILQILVYNNPEEMKIIPLFLGREGSELQL